MNLHEFRESISRDQPPSCPVRVVVGRQRGLDERLTNWHGGTRPGWLLGYTHSWTARKAIRGTLRIGISGRARLSATVLPGGVGYDCGSSPPLSGVPRVLPLFNSGHLIIA